mgnify:CR=1 FL=1
MVIWILSTWFSRDYGLNSMIGTGDGQHIKTNIILGHMAWQPKVGIFREVLSRKFLAFANSQTRQHFV